MDEVEPNDAMHNVDCTAAAPVLRALGQKFIDPLLARDDEAEIPPPIAELDIFRIELVMGTQEIEYAEK